MLWFSLIDSPRSGLTQVQDNSNLAYGRHHHVHVYVPGHSIACVEMGEEHADGGRIPLWLDCDPGQYVPSGRSQHVVDWTARARREGQ